MVHGHRPCKNASFHPCRACQYCRVNPLPCSLRAAPLVKEVQEKRPNRKTYFLCQRLGAKNEVRNFYIFDVRRARKRTVSVTGRYRVGTRAFIPFHRGLLSAHPRKLLLVAAFRTQLLPPPNCRSAVHAVRPKKES